MHFITNFVQWEHFSEKGFNYKIFACYLQRILIGLFSANNIIDLRKNKKGLKICEENTL